jgi:hypothetical protein
VGRTSQIWRINLKTAQAIEVNAHALLAVLETHGSHCYYALNDAFI